jgi:hypothetical protein
VKQNDSSIPMRLRFGTNLGACDRMPVLDADRRMVSYSQPAAQALDGLTHESGACRGERKQLIEIWAIGASESRTSRPEDNHGHAPL